MTTIETYSEQEPEIELDEGTLESSELSPHCKTVSFLSKKDLCGVCGEDFNQNYEYQKLWNSRYGDVIFVIYCGNCGGDCETMKFNSTETVDEHQLDKVILNKWKNRNKQEPDLCEGSEIGTEGSFNDDFRRNDDNEPHP